MVESWHDVCFCFRYSFLDDCYIWFCIYLCVLVAVNGENGTFYFGKIYGGFYSKTSESFICPNSRLPRHGPVKANASQTEIATITTAVTQYFEKELIMAYIDSYIIKNNRETYEIYSMDFSVNG